MTENRVLAIFISVMNLRSDTLSLGFGAQWPLDKQIWDPRGALCVILD